VLQHVACPRCHAPNLTTEYMCFACGAGLRPLPKRLLASHRAVPWPLWAGLLLALLVLGLVFYWSAQALAGYREQAALPTWYLPVAGAGLLLAAQIAFYQARVSDRRSWGLKRAPQLKLSQSHTGDVVWVRGKVECDTPLFAPYINQPCAYYRMVLREREPGKAGWRTVETETRSVDFRLAEEDESVYVPTGGVLFDAPEYMDSAIDVEGTQQVKVWALPVGFPASLFGKLEGEERRLRMDGLDDGLPAIATWRLPADYVALVARRARMAQLAGWAMTTLAVVAFLAALVHL